MSEVAQAPTASQPATVQEPVQDQNTQPTASQAQDDAPAPAGNGNVDTSVFEPKVAILHLERDGVIVEGPIDPLSGYGVRELLDALKQRLLEKPGAAAAAAVPDPNLARRERAKAAGHVLNEDTGHCDKCNAAIWWALDGNPCNPVQKAPAPTEAQQEEPADGSQDT